MKSDCFGYSSKLCRIVFSTLKMSSYHFFLHHDFNNNISNFYYIFTRRPLVEYLITLCLQKRDDKNTQVSNFQTCVLQCFREKHIVLYVLCNTESWKHWNHLLHVWYTSENIVSLLCGHKKFLMKNAMIVPLC